MIKELCYEWVLVCANFLGCQRRTGFFDKNKLYERKGWLDWEVTKLSDLARKEKGK